MNGVQVARILRRTYPELRLIGLSMHKDPAVAEMMLEAGASAYLTKGGPSESLLAAIREAARG